MEEKINGVIFKNVYKYNPMLTREAFELLCKMFDKRYKKNNFNNTYYVVLNGKNWILQDVFGDIDLYPISNNDFIEQYNILKTIGD